MNDIQTDYSHISHFENWDGTAADAIRIQKQLQQKIDIKPLAETVSGGVDGVRYIGGADVSNNRFAPDVFAGIIVLSFPDFKVVDRALIKSTTSFPYIPGLLSFREAPALIEAWKKLSIKPDVLMVDGQGIAHPRRMGIASHIGVELGIPTLGCAKNILYGVYEGIHKVRGSHTSANQSLDNIETDTVEPETLPSIQPLSDPKNGEQIGLVIQSKARTKPIIVSPGYRMNVADAKAIIMASLQGYRLPEPTRLAHETVNQFRKGEIA